MADTSEGAGVSVVRLPRLTTLAAVIAALLVPIAQAGVYGLMVARTRPSHSLVPRPDRLFGWDGAPYSVPIGLAVLATALLMLLVAVGLADKGRRVSAVVAAILVAAAAAASVAIQAFPAGPDMYEESPIRGFAALALVCCSPAAAIVAGVVMARSGSVLAGWLSVALGIFMAWAALYVSLIAARDGSPQPQLDAVVATQVIALPWFALVGLWLADFRVVRRLGRLPFSLPVRVHDPMVRLGRLGAVLAAALAVVVMVADLAPYGAGLGPTVTTQLTGRTRIEGLSVGGVQRFSRVYRPEQLGPRPGLIVVLHPVFGSGFQAEAMTGFAAQADRLHWLIAYPDGLLDGWDAFGSNSTWGYHPGVDDVAFIAALIDRLEASDGVDPGRVFVTGFSRGAMMTYRVGCELSSQIAAIAPVSGNMAGESGSATDAGCHLARPVSLLAIHGTADGSIPIAGGHVDIDYAPMVDVISVWRAEDGCAAEGLVVTEGASTITTWTCAGGSAVSARVVTGGSHSWPGAASPLYRTSNPADDFDASRLIADFFVAHARS
jgi:polyhydroxybutyrate depolymerase